MSGDRYLELCQEYKARETSAKLDGAMAPERDGLMSFDTKLFVIEVAGPAGAGKSTLVQRLAKKCPDARVGLPLPWLTHSRFLVGQVPLWLSSAVNQRGRGRWFTWTDTRAMAYTAAWLARLTCDSTSGVVVFDHGPLFRLARVDAFKGRRKLPKRLGGWWSHQLHSWLAVLDLVVVLDARDEVLVDRVRAREIVAAPGRMGPSEAGEFYRCYRESFWRILAARSFDDTFRLVRFDTERLSPEEIAERVAEEMRRGRAIQRLNQCWATACQATPKTR